MAAHPHSSPPTEPCQQEGYEFMAAAFEVYHTLGPGFTEELVEYLVNFAPPEKLSGSDLLALEVYPLSVDQRT